MKYWLTTHWPRMRTESPDAPHRGVWVPDGKRQVITAMSPGDLVWIYESQHGRPILKQKANGVSELIRRHVGRGGIVALVEVTQAPEEDLEAEVQKYGDGTSIWWRWRADTRTVNSAGSIDRRSLNKLMGYKPSYVFRGFGSRSSGLKEISESLHAQIHEAFLASHGERDRERLAKTRRRIGGRGKGGEGPVHKHLKEWIAAHPEVGLGEAGVQHVQTEYPFGATGDCIDVLLRDRHGRFIAVEVEPDCPEDHQSGPMQCVKYRALLAYQFDRQLEEVRTCLVARSVHDVVRRKANKHGITWVEVDASAAHFR